MCAVTVRSVAAAGQIFARYCSPLQKLIFLALADFSGRSRRNFQKNQLCNV
jgi:hypothetical protein